MTRIEMRRATAGDEDFIRELFAAEKVCEFAPLGWPAPQVRSLIEMQFRARQQSWAQSYPNAVNFILCLEDGTAAGRHLIDRQAECYRSVDLAVLPQHRNQGIGTQALQAIQALAASNAMPLRLRVATTNPALRLYERLGFQTLAADELACEMEWMPPDEATQHPTALRPKDHQARALCFLASQ